MTLNRSRYLKNKLTLLRDKRGFTLLELMIVLVVVAILLVASFPVSNAIENANAQKYYDECKRLFEDAEEDVEKFNRGWQVKPATEWVTDPITKRRIEVLKSSMSGGSQRVAYNLNYYFADSESKYYNKKIRRVCKEQYDGVTREYGITRDTPSKVYFLVVRESEPAEPDPSGIVKYNRVNVSVCDLNVTFDSQGEPLERLDVIKVIYYDGRRTHTLSYDPEQDDSFAFVSEDVTYSDSEVV